jgi:hypothetical protein
MAQTMNNQLTRLVDMVQVGNINLGTFASKLKDILVEGLVTRASTSIRHYRLFAPAAAAANSAATQYDLNTKAQADCPIAVSGEAAPDYPRNVKVTGTQLTGATSVTVTVTGIDQFGDSQTETHTVTTAAKTSTGNIAFAGVPVIVITAITGTGGAGDLLDVGYDLKFGLLDDVLNETDAIVKLNLDQADSGIADSTVDGTYNTIIFETAPNASRNYDIWYKSGLGSDTFDFS